MNKLLFLALATTSYVMSMQQHSQLEAALQNKLAQQQKNLAACKELRWELMAHMTQLLGYPEEEAVNELKRLLTYENPCEQFLAELAQESWEAINQLLKVQDENGSMHPTPLEKEIKLIKAVTILENLNQEAAQLPSPIAITRDSSYYRPGIGAIILDTTSRFYQTLEKEINSWHPEDGEEAFSPMPVKLRNAIRRINKTVENISPELIKKALDFIQRKEDSKRTKANFFVVGIFLGNQELVSTCLKNAKPDEVEHYHLPEAFHNAINNGDLATIQCLLDPKTNPHNQIFKDYFLVALFKATKYGHQAIIDLLINNPLVIECISCDQIAILEVFAKTQDQPHIEQLFRENAHKFPPPLITSPPPLMQQVPGDIVHQHIGLFLQQNIAL